MKSYNTIFCFALIGLLVLPCDADQLVLMSPHSDEIQNEFESAFVAFIKRPQSEMCG